MAYEVTDDSTVHGLSTPHGLATPHRFPRQSATPVDFFKGTSLLYPTGRVWNLPEGSDFKALHDAFNASLLDAVSQIYGMLDASFPDNANFDTLDAALWEYRLGIVYNSTLTLAQRMNNILQAMAFPQNIIARQHYLYIQGYLNSLGFDVFVYENIFFDGGGNLYQKTPAEIASISISPTQLGNGTQLGGSTELGGGGYSVIANSENPEDFSVGGVLWPTFFIGGSTLGAIASVPAARQSELRRSVLKVKPAETVAFLFVNYV